MIYIVLNLTPVNSD